ncbi:MAG: xanthine dehydrogenase family protein [Rhodospirillales bacterium]|nr:xanthine dehydrogenase family protein [Rhodospirillales bacterium]
MPSRACLRGGSRREPAIASARHPAFPAGSPVGEGVARPSALRLASGRGRYTDDQTLPRMVHLAFVRSPMAHARIRGIDIAAALAFPGVVRVVTGADIATVCKPMQVTLAHLPQHVSAEQWPIAIAEIAFQGEPVAAVVARSRREAEDAAELVAVDWEELPAVVDPIAALAAGSPMVHSSLGSNLAFSARFENGEVDRAFAAAAAVVEHRFDFGRVACVALESRAIIADYDPTERSLLVRQSHQSPHLMQTMFARHLGLAEHRVRVIAGDVGGAFGSKLHVYGDEIATAAIAVLLGRPVKFTADRLEAFQSDAQAREFLATGRLAADRDGRILAIDVDLVSGIGGYSIYPRSSLGDGLQAATFLGAAYDIAAFRSQLRVAYQNKVPSGALRGVGQPISCSIVEQLIDLAAGALDIDPAEMRRRNYLRQGQFPATSKGGLKMTELSLVPCLDRILELMDYRCLRQQQSELREAGIHRGIGFATFLEQTAPGAGLYGPGGLPITSQDSCIIRFEPSGTVRCEIGCSDQGQGTLTGIAQIVAATLGIPLDDVAVSAGDSAGAQGGGAWASRGLAISGEAAHAAARQLRRNLLTVAAAVLQGNLEDLDIRDRLIVDVADGRERLSLARVCEIAYYCQDLLPPEVTPELSATSHFTPRTDPYFIANGIQACHLEIDAETGWIKLLDHWIVDDCGHVINPLLVDDQLRGGIVQGLGAALFERCVYDEQGQQLTATMADYLVPMAAEMPDITIAHVLTPQPGTALGIKGVGEAGTIGATAAVWCAVNDALRPFGVRVGRQPFSPEVILTALGVIPTPPVVDPVNPNDEEGDMQ